MFERILHTQLSDAQIADFYLRLLASGRERMAYHPCPQLGVAEYVKMVRETPVWWLALYEGEPAGCFYLTDIAGRSAAVHFAYLPLAALRAGGLPMPVALTRWLLASTLYDRYPDGNFMMDCLMGKTPVWHKAAVKLLERGGGVILGVMPQCCFCHDSGQMSDGVISYYTRERIPEEWMHN